MKPLYYYFLRACLLTRDETFFNAAQDGHLATIKAILQEGVDDTVRERAARCAFVCGQIEAVFLIMEPETTELIKRQRKEFELYTRARREPLLPPNN